jgi:hypothetical protein
MGARMMYFANRNPALSPEEWPGRWRKHASYVAKAMNINPWFTWSAQCLCVREPHGIPGATGRFDGMTLMGLRDEECRRKLHHMGHTSVFVRLDEMETFAEYVEHFTLNGEDAVIRDGAWGKGTIVVFTCLRRRHDVAPAAFHAALAAHVARLSADRGFSARLTRATVTQVGAPWPVRTDLRYDGIMELWFPDLDAARAAFTDASTAAILDEAAAYADTVATERVVARINTAWTA